MAVQYYTNSAGQTEAKFIKILRKKLDEKGMDVNIWLWDYRFTGINRVMWSLDTIERLAKSCAGVAFHYYPGNIEQTKILCQQYPQLFASTVYGTM